MLRLILARWNRCGHTFLTSKVVDDSQVPEPDTWDKWRVVSRRVRLDLAVYCGGKRSEV
jgi:hypothetical protein